MRATSIRCEKRNNYQSDYYGTETQIKRDFISEFNKNDEVIWAKLFNETTGELMMELEKL